ncbi:MAG: hypothetical protein AAB787_01770 [Patescibacteria group bacterium]
MKTHLGDIGLVLLSFGIAVKFGSTGVSGIIASVCASMAGVIWANKMMPTIIVAAKYAALHPLPPKVRD